MPGKNKALVILTGILFFSIFFVAMNTVSYAEEKDGSYGGIGMVVSQLLAQNCKCSSKGAVKAVSKKKVKAARKNMAKAARKNTAKAAGKNIGKAPNKDISKGACKGTCKAASKNTVKNTGKDTGKEANKVNHRGDLVILSVFDGEPAQKSGLRPGDVIIRINGEAVKGKDLHQLSKDKLRGEPGTDLKLTIRRGGIPTPLQFVVTRKKISPSCYHFKRKITPSKDMVPVDYLIYGKGDTALLFIPDMNSKDHYWQTRLPKLSKKYRIIILDLLGTSCPGTERDIYIPKKFAQDVAAVVKDCGVKKVILISHLEEAGIMIRAARLVPEYVRGIISIDGTTLQGLEKTVDGLEK